MPFKSQAQVRKFFSMEGAGELPKGTAKRWADHTPNIKALPARANKVAPKRPEGVSTILAAEPAEKAKMAGQNTQLNAPSRSVLADYPDHEPAEAATMAELTEGGLTQVMDRARLRFMHKLATITPFVLPNGRQLGPCPSISVKSAAVPAPLPGTLPPTVQQAHQQMQAVAPTGQVRPAGSGPLLNTPPVSGQQAAPVPGLPGMASTNVIDMRGGLDATGQIVDGNHGAGIAKGFKMAGQFRSVSERLPIHVRLAKLRARRDPDGLERGKPWGVKSAAPQVPVLTEQPRRKKQPPTPPPGFPTKLVGTLATVGAGGLGLAHGMASDTHATDLRSALDRWKQPLAPHETMKSRYQDVFSVAANTQPFGVEAGTLLTAARSSPTLMGAMGQKDHLVKSVGDWHEGITHYDQFRRGPIPAFLHELRANGRGMPVPEGLGADYDQMLRPHFEGAWRKFVDENKLPGGLLENAAGWLEPHEIDQNLIPHETQLAFMKRFDESLPEAVRAERHRYETQQSGPAVNGAGTSYGGIVDKGLKARDALKTVGTTAGGAAAGATLGHLLHQFYAGRKAKRGLGYWASTLGGGALGGAAAYGLGTEHGRQTIKDLLAKITTKTAFERLPSSTLLKQLPSQAHSAVPITAVSTLLGAMLAQQKHGPSLDAIRGGAKGAVTGLGASAGNYLAGEHGEPLERAGLMIGGGLAGNLIGTKLWDRLTGDRDEDE